MIIRKFTDFLYQYKEVKLRLLEVRLRGKMVNFNHDRVKTCKLDNPPAWVVRERESYVFLEEVQDKPVYCMCRGVDDGSFMIACDACEEWYHGKCVGVTEESGEEIFMHVLLVGRIKSYRFEEL
ncbi:hypothetical protein DPMN_109744 [Dreissena polymorpha]|uniref:PHD-type domain-containing protein n=1 Tax=Dreissena polymorpha TaxID=45954 RepID=A0A9D4KBI6_DREPO|nr:hypothetical protein DPMN_109744 [Dreissena polymorpha]